MGGQFRRCEYLSVGEALRQACESETKATNGGQTICSEDVKKYIDKYFSLEEIVEDPSNDHHHSPGHLPGVEMKFYKITKYTGDKLITKSEAYLMRTRFSLEKVRQKFSELKTFVPAAISLHLEIEKESWSKEIRMLSIMFVNLKVHLSQTKNEEGIKRIQSIVRNVQRSIYQTRGSLNKFLMDDKGSVMLMCWGLPPLSCSDDHVRSVLSALSLMEELKKYKCGALIGVTTGTCFTGVCGTIGNRREYSVLGEVVNLSARYMGEAMKISKMDKLDNVVLVDEITKNLIQNKIRCQYVSSNNLKGFTEMFNFYTPVEEYKFEFIPTDPFPFIRTHRNNPRPLRCPPDEKHDEVYYFNKSLVMAGRKQIKNKFIKFLEGVYLDSKKELIVIRGVTGSGKSLFVRKSLQDFLCKHHELLEKNLHNENILSLVNTFEKSGEDKIYYNFPREAEMNKIKPYFIFTSFQLPTTHNNLMNGFSKILREIYFFLLCFGKDIVSNKPNSLKKIKLEDNSEVNCDVIGRCLFKKNSISYVKFIEEILETDLSCHYNIVSNFGINIEECKVGDRFFDRVKCDLRSELPICNFFGELVKMYFKVMNNYYEPNKIKNKTGVPLIFIVEDTQSIDDLSIRFIKFLRDLETNANFNSFCLILTYQDPLISMMKSPNDKISKFADIINGDIITGDELDTVEDKVELDHTENSFNPPKTFMMENILDSHDLKDLIKKHLSERILDEFKINLNIIDEDLLRILISKSFKGVPLFLMDILDNLINSKKYVQVLAGELIVTSELIEMDQTLDWSEFTIPMRLEKIIGNIIDTLTTKEIILLKHASIIGNIFDLHKLNEINPFNNVTKQDLYSLLKSLEEKQILEFLHDLDQKKLVCKFSVPFFREILYQRMLIEQKTEIHSVLARSMQFNKFKYLPHEKEVKIIEKHLKNSEKTLMTQMQDDIYEIMKNDKGMIHLQLMIEKLKENDLNINNMKMISLKNICEKLKYIDLKIDLKNEISSEFYGASSFIETKDHKNRLLNKDKLPQGKNNNVEDKAFQSIRSGYIEKMSEKSSLSWESRYVVVTNSKFMYFYHEKEFVENKMPLGTIILENLFNVEILRDGQIGSKRNMFSLNVTSWFKKDAQKGGRKFIFSTSNREDLHEWTITLNFLSVKATYNHFSSQYGQFRLPLKHQSQKIFIHKKIKEKFSGPELFPDKNFSKDTVMRNTFRLYNNIIRKSGVNDMKINNNNSMGSSGKLATLNVRRTTMSLFKKVSYNTELNEDISEFGEKKEKVLKTKNIIQEIFHFLIIIIGYAQDIIFNTEHFGGGDNKIINLPVFLKELEVENSPTRIQLNFNLNESLNVSEKQIEQSEHIEESHISENKNLQSENTVQQYFSHESSEEKQGSQEEDLDQNKVNKINSKIITFHAGEINDTEKKITSRLNSLEKDEEISKDSPKPRQTNKSQITFNYNNSKITKDNLIKNNIQLLNPKIYKNENDNDFDDDNLSEYSEKDNNREISKDVKLEFNKSNIEKLEESEEDEEGYISEEELKDKRQIVFMKNEDPKKYELVHSIQEEIENFKTFSEESVRVVDAYVNEIPVVTEMSPMVEDEPNSSKIRGNSVLVNESKFDKKTEKISNFSKPILIEDNQKSNLSMISNSKEKSHSKLNKTQKVSEKDYGNENKIMKNSISSNLNQEISQDINNSVTNLVRSGNYPPHEDIAPPGSKIENIHINYPTKTNNMIKSFDKQPSSSIQKTLKNSKTLANNTKPIKKQPIIDKFIKNVNIVGPNNISESNNSMKKEIIDHHPKIEYQGNIKDEIKNNQDDKINLEQNLGTIFEPAHLIPKIEQIPINSKPEDGKKIAATKNEDKNLKNENAQNPRQFEENSINMSKPIQLGIRNFKKPNHIKSNSADSNLEEIYNTDKPLDPNKFSKIKERIRQKSKEKKNYINNINVFLFNTINANNDMIDKLTRLRNSNEEGEGRTENFLGKSNIFINKIIYFIRFEF